MSNKLVSKEEKLEIMKGENLVLYNYHHKKGNSDETFMKYARIVKDFTSYLCSNGLNLESIGKSDIIDYAKYLKEHTRSINTCNNKLSILNVYFTFINRTELCVDLFRTVKKEYIDDDRYLDKKDFFVLEKYAKDDIELDAILHTIAGTGIRVSELKFFTYEAVKSGEVNIYNKKKERTVAIHHKLKMKLLDYCKSKGIKSGYLFTADGKNPYDRVTIWSKLKKLAKTAGVLITKVFPHALRHLFARLNYEINKDLESLKVILGHSRIETTLLYLLKTKSEYAEKMDIGLID